VTRVLLVSGSSTGGIARHLGEEAAAAAARGWQVTVAAPAAVLDSPGLRPVTAGTGAGVTPVALAVAARPRPHADAASIGRLVGLARRADVVHAHGVRAGGLAALALLLLRLAGRRPPPLAVTWHNVPQGAGSAAGRRLSGLLEQLCTRGAAVSLCVSPDLVDRVRERGGRAILAPVGARLRPVDRGRDATRASSEVPADGVLVLAVGRLHPQKGIDVLLAAAPAWAGLGRPVVVAVAGDGPERARLEALAAGCPVPVRFLGAREDVGDLLAAADVVVLPSRWEGSPLAAHEALLAGRPLVATRVGGVPELVGAGAVLVPPDDPAALTAAVAALVADPGAAAELAARGLQQAARWPDAEAAARRSVELLDDLVAGR
jgi:glycosyltransferase involved in cell wall biosynthesis